MGLENEESIEKYCLTTVTSYQIFGYVLTVNGEVLVKRVEFDHFENKVKIYSENARYPGVKVIQIDSDNIRIEGKVVGWYHNHPY
jgi:phage repressor protein C with HTH and peptisase S24 domain